MYTHVLYNYEILSLESYIKFGKKISAAPTGFFEKEKNKVK